jgi:histidyl-tRNA synthetase
MMPEIKAPRGTIDRFPPDSERYEYVIDRFKCAASKHGYLNVHTPTFEDTSLFSRGVGESTDIVMKEMYSFKDKKGRDLTLRPEMTAGVVRALIQAGKRYTGQIDKFAYYGPMFRYDRPQKGRYREFFQVGIEAIGDKSPYLDIDVILVGWDYLTGLGIDQDSMVVLLNSIGDMTDRNRYLEILREHLRKVENELCPDCKTRLNLNTLRVFDCKVPRCQELILDAPTILDHISDANRDHFETVKNTIESFGVHCRIDKKLVRGLDYYTHTVFEVFPTGEEQASQGALLGGGRYDGLFANLSDGKLDFPAVGFASGVERVADAVNWDKQDINAIHGLDFYIVILGESAKPTAYKIARKLQAWGFSADVDYTIGKLKNQFKRSEDKGAKSLIIIGESEIVQNIVKYKPSKDEEITIEMSVFDGDKVPSQFK